jgi:integrase
MAYYGLDVEEYLKSAINPRSWRGRPIPDPISQEDADLILEHVNELISKTSIKESTAKVTATYLVMFARASPGLLSITTKDVNDHIRRANKTLKQNTRRRYIAVLKRFLLWLIKRGYNRFLDREEIGEIKAPGLDLKDRKGGKILTGPEIMAMITAAKNSRDRAIMMMMYEGALRPIELVSATWDAITLLDSDEQRIKFNTAEKTGKPRYIPLIQSKDYLLAWRNDYPGNPEGDTPVFVGLKTPHHPITQSAIKTIIYNAARDASISKAVKPYLFRHSRITHMLANQVPETTVKKIAWGSVRSHQLATYEHLDDEDIDRIMLAKAGIKTPENKSEVGLKPRQCPKCLRVHPATDRYCRACGTGLTAAALKEQENFRGFLKGPGSEYIQGLEEKADMRRREHKDQKPI